MTATPQQQFTQAIKFNQPTNWYACGQCHGANEGDVVACDGELLSGYDAAVLVRMGKASFVEVEPAKPAYRIVEEDTTGYGAQELAPLFWAEYRECKGEDWSRVVGTTAFTKEEAFEKLGMSKDKVMGL